MKKDLPIYDIKLSDDTQGVGFISLVDEPAIGVDWIKLAKQEVEEPIELFMSLTGDGLCFGCPPNGDGTRVNGEPDGRCKGDSAGGGSKAGGSKAGSVSSKVYEDTTTIKDPAEIEKIMSEDRPDKPSFDTTPNAKDIGGDPLREITVDEVKANAEWLMKEPVLINTKPTSERGSNPDMIEFIGRERATQVAIAQMTGSWLSTADVKDFLDGRMSVQRGNGPSFAMKDSIFKMNKVVKSMMARKSPKSIMAKKAVGTLDGSGCFGCPPNGDGTRVNGEPDARCKGDGSGKTGGTKGGSKGSSGLKSISEKDIKDSLAKNGKVELTSEQKAQFDELRKPGGKFKEVIDKREMVRRGGVTVGVYTERALMYPISVNARDLYNGGNNERSSYPAGLQNEKVLYEKNVTQTNTAEGNNFVGSSYENAIAKVQEIGGKTVYTPFAGKEDAFLKIFKN